MTESRWDSLKRPKKMWAILRARGECGVKNRGRTPALPRGEGEYVGVGGRFGRVGCVRGCFGLLRRWAGRNPVGLFWLLLVGGTLKQKKRPGRDPGRPRLSW